MRSGNGSGTEASRTRRFGVFELDLHAGELRRGGVKVKIQEQPFQVLSLLLEKPGEVVTRDDLRHRLWPADTFVDFDHSLNAAIRRVRDALGDSAENPTFVETVARRGYRFLAPVSAPPVNGAAVAQPESPATLAHPQPHRVRWIAGGAAAVALVLFGIRLGLSFARHHPVAQVQPRISRLTANPADDRVRAAAISRDGKYLAFSDDTGFYLRQIDTGETHPVNLPKGFVARSIGWFPDSAHMVVALENASQTTSLWEISALGGSPHKLLDDGFSPAVSPDGREIGFITAGKMGFTTAGKMRAEIWLMDADGEQPHKLVGQEGDFFGSLAWSPDGTKIAYTRGRVGHIYGLIGEIGVVGVRDQHVGTILQINSLGWFVRVDGPLAWTADGRLIYAIGEAPPRQLDSNLWSLALDANGHPTDSPLRWTTDPGAVTSISASGDGKRIVYVKGAPQPDVYVAKLEGSTFVSQPSRLTLDDRQDIPYDWTPDSKAVFFISDRTGTFKIYRQGIAQTVPDLLVGGNKPLLGPRLNPDGTQLLYLAYPDWSDRASPVSLMRMPLAGGAPQQILQRSWIGNQQCARVPANLCLYSYNTDGKLTFMRFDPLKGNDTQIYQLTVDLPQFYNWSLSPDGSTLAISKWTGGPEEPRIRLVSLGGGGEKWLTISLTGLDVTGMGAFDWAADGKSLWITSVGEDENALLNVDLQGRARMAWRPKKMTVYWAIPSRDGQYLALHVGSTSANAWMLERP